MLNKEEVMEKILRYKIVDADAEMYGYRLLNNHIEVMSLEKMDVVFIMKMRLVMKE